MCQDNVKKHPDVRCILYAGKKCDGRQGMKKLLDGDRIINVEKLLYFDVESISVTNGCRLTVFTGNGLEYDVMNF